MTNSDRQIVPHEPGEFILYQTEDGLARVDVRVSQDTVWLSLNQMAELFQRDKSSISKHLTNLFEEGELRREATVAKFATAQLEGGRQVARDIDHYNLDVIISVGYRVKSHRGTQFRIWATQRLREYLIKGFTMDDERLKRSAGRDYFDELLARVRDIRSSEKLFWRKVLDIYASSIDYDADNDLSKRFFATVQNKMHWAAHGHTAAEIVAQRADAQAPHMGLTTWSGERPRKSDVRVAKNYLTKDEIEALNLIVSFYLDFAELQALSRRPMHMRDWIAKLDDFLRLSERDILSHAGKISHDDALAKAEAEYEKHRATRASLPSPVEQHFDEAVKELKRLDGESPTEARKPRKKAKRAAKKTKGKR